MKRILLITTLLLASCSGNTSQNTAEALIAVCGSYSVGLNELASLRAQGKLDAPAIATVDHVVSIVDPICTASTPPVDLAGALSVVQAEVPAILALIVK